ncbi:hypothetical protein GGR53DRAFT_461524 [Hypoxylon sp. FL1150]|nr:hypothetical protein GGR53DRAFT_461524 [Hypoxylon sp. FL1150]
MSFGPRRQPLKHSKRLKRDIEDELRVLVFDAEEDPTDRKVQQLIIGNPVSLCNGFAYISGEGPHDTTFVFHHAVGEGRYTVQCGCIKKHEADERTTELPLKLQLHRLKLMFRPPYKLEAKYAAMVVMKLYLNMPVPEELQIKAEEKAEDASHEKLEEQEAIPESVKEEETPESSRPADAK